MQIILKYVYTKEQFLHINTINLTDNSGIKFGDRQLQLLYLRTIMHGMPYYGKYGFEPIDVSDKKNFLFNKIKFTQKPILTKEYLNLFSTNYLDSNEEKILNDFVNMELSIRKVIYVNKLFILLVSRFKIYQKALDNTIDQEYKITLEKTTTIFNLLRKMYKRIFNYVGYKPYNHTAWILYIIRN